MADVDDLPNIYPIVDRLNAHPKFSQFLTCDRATVKNFTVNSYVWPASYGLLVVFWEGRPCGLAALQVVSIPGPAYRGAPVIGKHCLMHSVYIDHVLDGDKVPSHVGTTLNTAIDMWARAQGCSHVYANHRVDGNFKALEKKYGLKCIHSVLCREVGINGQ